MSVLCQSCVHKPAYYNVDINLGMYRKTLIIGRVNHEHFAHRIFFTCINCNMNYFRFTVCFFCDTEALV